jgi:hypothetical protein
MTQTMTEQFTEEEYSHFLAYGDPVDAHMCNIANDQAHMCDNDNDSVVLDWISTLDSTTYPSMTFGYHVTPYTST